MSSDIPKILIADDDPDILKVVESIFADERFSLFFAKDGQEVLTITEREQPDLILLDINIPKKNGIEVCRLIRESEHNSNVVIIIVSGMTLENDLIKGFEGGADDYITKPFSIGNLKSRVKSWLMRKGIAV